MEACGFTHDFVSYFNAKTDAILQRYGPGPRVHYHTGLLDNHACGSSALMRQTLVDAQERLLYYGAAVWDARSTLRGAVLDVGCGLGGGAIFWAQEFGAHVTAVTCVASHIPLVAQFARQAGVGSQVQPLLCDALAVPGENRFDAAVAVDSSGYLARGPWLKRVAALLRPAGHVFIVDCFLGRSDYQRPFDSYWHTRIGTIEEYLSAAQAAGLRLESFEDLSQRTETFWTTTIALTEAESREQPQTAAGTAHRQASIRAHSLVRRGLVDGGLRYAMMNWRKP